MNRATVCIGISLFYYLILFCSSMDIEVAMITKWTKYQQVCNLISDFSIVIIDTCCTLNFKFAPVSYTLFFKILLLCKFYDLKIKCIHVAPRDVASRS